MPHRTAQSHLQLQLLFLAALAASGEIDLHVQNGRCTVIVPPRLPDDPEAPPLAFGGVLPTVAQARVVHAVGAILQRAARDGLSGRVWVTVVAGVPLYPPDSVFPQILPDAPARQLPRRAPTDLSRPGATNPSPVRPDYLTPVAK